MSMVELLERVPFRCEVNFNDNIDQEDRLLRSKVSCKYRFFLHLTLFMFYLFSHLTLFILTTVWNVIETDGHPSTMEFMKDLQFMQIARNMFSRYERQRTMFEKIQPLGEN